MAAKIVCLWKIFVKIGEPGWKALIPFYSGYTLCQHTWGNGWMMLTHYIPTAGPFMSFMTNWRLLDGFGKPTFFKIFSLILPIVAYAICGFDKSTFCDQIDDELVNALSGSNKNKDKFAEDNQSKEIVDYHSAVSDAPVEPCDVNNIENMEV